MRRLEFVPQRLAPGRYAERLRRLVAKTEPQREVDLMICGAFIEARSCERFAALVAVIGGAAGRAVRGPACRRGAPFQGLPGSGAARGRARRHRLGAADR